MTEGVVALVIVYILEGIPWHAQGKEVECLSRICWYLISNEIELGERK